MNEKPQDDITRPLDKLVIIDFLHTDAMKAFFREVQKGAIIRFVNAVEREAETNMLKTGKLEGAHYAAMKRIAAIILD